MPLTLAVAPQSCPWPRRSGALGNTEAGLTSDGADARRARFGPNVLTSYRGTALGVLTRQLRNLGPVGLPSGPSRRPTTGRSYRQGAGDTSDRRRRPLGLLNSGQGGSGGETVPALYC
jgi:hypothetical protein